jgi:hypothetical protein
MARPSTPIAIHKAHGTYRADRHAGKLVVPDEALGPAPEWFNDLMREEWARLSALTHIKAAHRTIALHACVLYSRFAKDAQGGEPMKASERQTFHSVYMQLALTPASQAKVAAEPATKAEDPWAKLG